MNNLNWLIRASNWARNPPGPRKVKLVLGVIAVGLVLLALEKLGWWPEWATMERTRGMRLPR